jgi:hypothetical protein
MLCIDTSVQESQGEKPDDLTLQANYGKSKFVQFYKIEIQVNLNL